MFSIASAIKNNGLRPKENLHDGSFAFRHRSTAYLRMMLDGTTGPEATVDEARFDAFGEPVKYDNSPAAIARRSLSGWVASIGIGLFWLLVAGVIAARVFYFDPNFTSKFG